MDFDDDDVEANFRVFDEEDLVGKFERVKASLDTLDTSNLTECSALLQEFHRNVEIDIVNNWEGSSVSQVCLAEGTTVYVRFDEIARVNELVAEEGLFENGLSGSGQISTHHICFHSAFFQTWCSF